MNFRITLGQNLPGAAPSAVDVTIDYRDGTTKTWPVAPVGACQNVAVVVVSTAVDLLANPASVLRRTLVTHYPTAPHTVETAISSIQPAILPAQEHAMNFSSASAYQITITMGAETVGKLGAQGYNLYGFKAVNGAVSGTPVLWFQANSSVYGQETDIKWVEQYAAYVSNSGIVPGGTISNPTSYDAGLGDELVITSPSGLGAVQGGGTPGAISIYDSTTSPFGSCGIAQSPTLGGSQPQAAPICAFPLNGNNMVVIEPIEQIFLMFATEQVNTGTVIEQSFGPGMTVDLTLENSRSVSYDINEGWSWGGGIWGQSFQPGTDLVSLLVQNSPSLTRRVTSRRSLKLAA